MLLLDDARSAAQVLPFVSNLPGVLVVVTSTVPLQGLAQFRPRELDVMPLADPAVAELFREILGTMRTAAEPAAFAELVRMCAGLPLLASHAAGLLHDHKDLRLADLAERMKGHGRLGALQAGGGDSMPGPSEVFEVIYQDLSPNAASLYRVIGLHPVRDFDAGLVNALSGVSPADQEDGWASSGDAGSSRQTSVAAT